jgi:hypothetical protein
MAGRLSRFFSRLSGSAALVVLSAGLAGAQDSSGGAGDGEFTFTPEPQRIAAIDVPIDLAVAPSPDGRFYAALQTRPSPILWIIPSDGSDPFAYREMWAAYKPRWAPSGNRIGFIAGIGPPRIWTIEVDPETGRPTDPPRMLIRTATNAFAFSPDGERVALIPRRSTAAGASTIHIVEWRSRRARTMLRESGMIYRLDWSPDGASIIYGVAPSEADSTHRIVSARVRDGRRRVLMQAGEYLGLSPDGGYVLYRPEGWVPGDGSLVAVASIGGQLLARLKVPDGPVPRWGAGPASLVQVMPKGDGDVVWEIPACPLCLFSTW